jgi:hypothetical protein
LFATLHGPIRSLRAILALSTHLTTATATTSATATGARKAQISEKQGSRSGENDQSGFFHDVLLVGRKGRPRTLAALLFAMSSFQQTGVTGRFRERPVL